MSGKYKYPCLDLLSEPDHTCSSRLNTRQIDGKGLATEDVDAELSQKLNEIPQKDLSPSETHFDERDSLSEYNSESEIKPQRFTLLAWLGECWQELVDSLSRPSELKIRQRHDNQGNLWWIVYDPITNRSAQLASEDEVRMWIEKSYQHRFRHSQGRW
jgi:hypothetical protein